MGQGGRCQREVGGRIFPPHPLVPAKAGIQHEIQQLVLDPRLRGDEREGFMSLAASQIN